MVEKTVATNTHLSTKMQNDSTDLTKNLNAFSLVQQLMKLPAGSSHRPVITASGTEYSSTKSTMVLQNIYSIYIEMKMKPKKTNN